MMYDELLKRIELWLGNNLEDGDVVRVEINLSNNESKVHNNRFYDLRVDYKKHKRGGVEK